MSKQIIISRKKAESILSCLSVLAGSPYHARFTKECAEKDFKYMDKKLYPKQKEKPNGK